MKAAHKFPIPTVSFNLTTSAKPKKGGGKYDLYKDKSGNIIVKPKSGKGPGEYTGINLKDLQ
jgi:hypothetical protein